MQNRLAKKISCEVSASVNRSKVDARRSFQGKAPVSMRIFVQISSGAINAFLLLQLPCNLEASCNPLFEGADPDIIFANNKYWIYPTGTGEGQEAYVYSSSDLQSWQKQGPYSLSKMLNGLNPIARRSTIYGRPEFSKAGINSITTTQLVRRIQHQVEPELRFLVNRTGHLSIAAKHSLRATRNLKPLTQWSFEIQKQKNTFSIAVAVQAAS